MHNITHFCSIYLYYLSGFFIHLSLQISLNNYKHKTIIITVIDQETEKKKWYKFTVS